MSFRTKLFKFAKRKNSTLRPDITQPGYYEGDIKEDFNPVSFEMVFDFGNGNSSVPDYNYAYIQDFGRYYYITEWLFISGLWRAAMTVDVLATYKTEILASRQYITRAAQGSVAPGIIDTAYPTNGGTIVLESKLTTTEFWGSEYGVVVIGTIGNSGKNVGAVTYYAMGVGGFRNLMTALLDDISWANISVSEISEELQKALIDPAQYIVSAIWLPFNATNFIVNSGAPASDITSDIALGWWSFSIAAGGNVARILHNPLFTFWDIPRRKRYIEIPKHDQIPALFDRPERPWLQLAPYSRYTLTFLPFGSFDLDTTDLYGKSYIGLEVLIQAYTGDATLTISAALDDQGTGEKVLTVINANCGVPLPVGQISLDVGNFDSAIQSAAIMGATEIAQNIASTPAVVSNTTPAVSGSEKISRTGGHTHSSHSSVPKGSIVGGVSAV